MILHFVTFSATLLLVTASAYNKYQNSLFYCFIYNTLMILFVEEWRLL